MSRGQGSINRINRTAAVPFPANSARNGLSVDSTGHIVLGQDIGAVGDPGRLLNNREIPLNGQVFNIGKAGSLFTVYIDDLNQVFAVGDDPFNVFPGLYIDIANRDFALGDFFVAHNGNYIEVDDLTNNVDTISQGRLRIGTGTFNTGIHLNDPVGSHAMDYRESNNKYLFLDPLSNSGRRVFRMGDLGGAFNNSFIEVDDGVKLFRFQVGVHQWINVDDINKQASIGDLNGSGQGTRIQVADQLGAGVFTITNTALNAIVQINNVNGFTGTKTPPASITVIGGIVTNVT